MFVKIDVLLDDLLKDIEKTEKLKKRDGIKSRVKYLEIVMRFQNSFPEDMKPFLLNQFKCFSEDYGSNKRRLIRNFIFTITGEGYFQEEVNGEKFYKNNSFQSQMNVPSDLTLNYESINRGGQ